jgi:hypothetical protein
MYSNSRVLDHGRLEWPYLTCVEFWFYKMFSEKWSLCRTKYLEGTAVARECFGILEGYCRGDGSWSCMIDHGCFGANKKEFPPFLEPLQKFVL